MEEEGDILDRLHHHMVMAIVGIIAAAMYRLLRRIAPIAAPTAMTMDGIRHPIHLDIGDGIPETIDLLTGNYLYRYFFKKITVSIYFPSAVFGQRQNRIVRKNRTNLFLLCRIKFTESGIF